MRKQGKFKQNKEADVLLMECIVTCYNPLLKG